MKYRPPAASRRHGVAARRGWDALTPAVSRVSRAFAARLGRRPCRAACAPPSPRCCAAAPGSTPSAPGGTSVGDHAAGRRVRARRRPPPARRTSLSQPARTWRRRPSCGACSPRRSSTKTVRRADVGLLADRRVARRTTGAAPSRPSPISAFFVSTNVPTFAFAAEPRARPQVRERPDGRARADLGPHRVRPHHRRARRRPTVSISVVSGPTTAPAPTAVRAAQLGVLVDHRVAAPASRSRRSRSSPGRGWSRRRASSAVVDPVAQQRPQRRPARPGRCSPASPSASAATCTATGVPAPTRAARSTSVRYSSPWSLSVDSLPSASPQQRARRTRTIPALISRIARSLGRGVALLDDPLQAAGRVADDPAQPGRVGHLGGQHGRRRAGRLVRARPARSTRLRPQQRHVAVEHHHGAGQRPATASSAIRTAWPVPCCSACSTGVGAPARPRRGAPRPGRRRARPPPACGRRRAARPRRSTWPSRVRPSSGCSTFGIADFIRLPSPAARTISVLVRDPACWSGVTCCSLALVSKRWRASS